MMIIIIKNRNINSNIVKYNIYNSEIIIILI